MRHSGVLHLHCPHCHNPIEFVEAPPAEEVICPSCGSTFHVKYTGTGDSTNRLFTFDPNGAAIDASANGALNFTGTGALVASGSGDRTVSLWRIPAP